MDNQHKIDNFKGKYYFLSNFFSRKVTYKGITYENNEAAFHAQKDVSRANEFVSLIPPEAKKLGRKVKLRQDWEQVKDQVMYEICLAKFEQNPDLAKRLIATGNTELIEGNTWGDNYWGVCDPTKGKNKLGQILMRIRSELREN